MNQEPCKVAVTSRSFSKHEGLRNELLKKYPKTDFNDFGESLSGQRLVEFLSGHTKAITALETLDEPILKQLPELEVISKYGVGLDNVDQEACKNRHVHVGWSGGVNRRGVAEMTLCFMIGLSRRLFISAHSLRGSNDWSKLGGSDLSGQIIGIIGVGHIGKEVIRLLKPFGCNILVNDIVDQSDFYRKEDVIETSKEDIYVSSHVVSIHTPLNETTRRLMNAETFSRMKDDAYFINVARGGIVDQNALKHALKVGPIAGAAVDVCLLLPASSARSSL